MPLYEFVCQQCGQEQELLIRGEAMPQCEKCGGEKLTRLLSAASAHTTSSTGGPPPEGPCGSSCGCFPS